MDYLDTHTQSYATVPWQSVATRDGRCCTQCPVRSWSIPTEKKIYIHKYYEREEGSEGVRTHAKADSLSHSFRLMETILLNPIDSVPSVVDCA
jgi:hypothetical protein